MLFIFYSWRKSCCYWKKFTVDSKQEWWELILLFILGLKTEKLGVIYNKQWAIIPEQIQTGGREDFQNFQEWQRKNNMEFPGVFVLGLGIFKEFSTILWIISRVWALFCLEFPGVKLKKWKISGGYILNPPLFGFFFWME